MKHRIIFVFLLLFIFTQLVNAQTRVNQRKIKWAGVKTQKINEKESINFLYFDDAFYDANSDNLPMYFERFKTNSINVKVEVILNNPVYEELSNIEKSVIKNLQIIKSEVVITSRISIVRKVSYADVFILPIRKNKTTGRYEKLISFDLRLKITPAQTAKTKQRIYADHSVLSAGEWIKVEIDKSGIYKLSYSDLQGMGMNVNAVNTANIGVFGNGGGMLPEANSLFRYDDLQENAIFVYDANSNGVFENSDYLLFYGKSHNTWSYNPNDKKFHHSKNIYSNNACYFVTSSQGTGKRITEQPSQPSPNTFVTTFDDYDFHERDVVNLIKSGRQWYGEVFDIVTNYNFVFNFPDIDVGTKVYLRTNVAAKSTIESSFNINAAGTPLISTVGAITTVYSAAYARQATDTISFPVSSSSISISYNYNKTTSTSIGWLNYVELNCRRHLYLSSSQLLFRDIKSVSAGNISGFAIGNATSTVRIWDVTNPINVIQIGSTLNGSSLSFTVTTDSLRDFIAFSGTSFLSPAYINKVENQDLHSLSNYDYIIITHPDFIAVANQLAAYHTEKNELSTLVVTTLLIYNEFSSGTQDITAIRDFVKMFYDKAGSNPGKMPRYLLLLGDGSYDYKGLVTPNTNFVPSFQSRNSLHPAASYVTDDYFGLLDDLEGYNASGNLDIGIGRFPVQTAEKARQMFEKGVRYASKVAPDIQSGGCSSGGVVPNLADWRNIICFVADDEDGNLHLNQAEEMANNLDTNYNDYNIDKIYLDAYIQVSTPGGQRYYDVNKAINNRVGKGALILNYTGHGGEVGWAHERILEISDINKWSNKYNLPVFITATCEFSRFDDPERVSAGELVFLNPNGGGIALFTTTRLAYAQSNLALNKKFYKHALKKENGQFPRLGDLIRYAKTPLNDNIKNFVLLGDPALQMAYPEYNIITTHINGIAVNTTTDTLKALSRATIRGIVADDNGDIISDFNGILYPTVYDKATKVYTLGNDNGSNIASFKLQKNILYKGKASVINGEFTFTFIVPKDIAYQYGPGRISYYAQNGETDANGFFEDFIVGGSEDSVAIDNNGPTIDLYLNNENFVFGGITDENPMLLAYVFDSNGINTVGNGIGHDLVAILDENTDHSYVLNDYYEADLDSYTSGSIRYPFSDIGDGLHTLKLKVWDVYNNSSDAYTEFIVAESANLALSHVLNYPNPFTTNTSFYFEHNHPCCYLDVQIQIFTISGILVKTIIERVITDGYRAEPISWDGKDDFGDRIGRGVYIYRLKVQTENGSSSEKTEKLVILK